MIIPGIMASSPFSSGAPSLPEGIPEGTIDVTAFAANGGPGFYYIDGINVGGVTYEPGADGGITVTPADPTLSQVRAEFVTMMEPGGAITPFGDVFPDYQDGRLWVVYEYGPMQTAGNQALLAVGSQVSTTPLTPREVLSYDLSDNSGATNRGLIVTSQGRLPGDPPLTPIRISFIGIQSPTEPAPGDCICENQCDDTWFEPLYGNATWDAEERVWKEGGDVRHMAIQVITTGPNANWTEGTTYRPSYATLVINSGPEPEGGGLYNAGVGITINTRDAMPLTGELEVYWTDWDQDQTITTGLNWNADWIGDNPIWDALGEIWLDQGGSAVNAITPKIKCIRFHNGDSQE